MKRFEGIAKEPPPQPGVERISDRVISILGYNAESSFTLNGTNCYLVGTGKERILIDTAYGNGTEDQFSTFLANLDKTLQEEGCKISLILITHLHSDHFGGCEALQEIYGPGIPVGMMPIDQKWAWTEQPTYTDKRIEELGLVEIVENGPKPVPIDWNGKHKGMRWDEIDHTFFNDEFPLPEGGATLPHWGDFEDVSWDRMGRTKEAIVHAYFSIKERRPIMEKFRRFRRRWEDDADETMPAHRLVDGEVLRVEGANLQVWYAPGHSANHTVFTIEEDHSIFSGDHVLGFGTTQLSDLFDYMGTLERMVSFQPTKLYPGHGPHIQDGTGLITRYLEHRQAREDQVIELMNTTVDDAEWAAPTTRKIARFLYTNTSEKKMWMAAQNIEKIMVKLWLDGRVDAVECEEDDESGKLVVRRSQKVDLTERRYYQGPPDAKDGVSWLWHSSSTTTAGARASAL